MMLTLDVSRLLHACIKSADSYAKRKSLKCLQVHLRQHSSRALSNLEYCVELVRKSDNENYLATLLLPKEAQRAAFALRAFNVELAQVRDTVSERKIGLMRMQFWREALEGIYRSSPPHTPIAMELAGACGYFNLSKRWLDRIVEARASQLEGDTFTTMASVENYAENVNSSLYYLLLECLGIKNVHADHVASHLGKAQGIVTLIRAIPYHAARRQVYIPLEILSKHSVSQEDVIRGTNSQPLKDAIFAIASTANQHLEKARSLKKDAPDKAYLAFLNASICDFYLKALQKVDFNIFDGKLRQKDALLAYRMYMKKFTKKY